MQLWSSKRWGARIRRKGEDQCIDLERPFALVGSDPRCDVQIGDSKLPSVVYLAVAFGDRIEVWPTCPLAFPIWGRVSKHQILLAGKSRIQFFMKDDPKLMPEGELEDEDSLDISKDDAFGAGIELPDYQPPPVHFGAGKTAIAPPTAQLILDWGSGPRPKALSRNVSIIGEDHPSLIRLHRAVLRQCDHGVVCYGDDVWLIDLHPERLAEDESVIRRVMPGDPSVWVGGIQLWVKGAEAIDLENLVRSVASQPAGHMDHPEITVDAPASSRDVGIAIETEAEIDERGANVACGTDREVVRNGSASNDEVERLTMRLTDRMLETNARKAYRRRLIKITAIYVLAVLAVIVIVTILFMGVMPILRSIYLP